jgi:hypothetical protein
VSVKGYERISGSTGELFKKKGLRLTKQSHHNIGTEAVSSGTNRVTHAPQYTLAQEKQPFRAYSHNTQWQYRRTFSSQEML